MLADIHTLYVCGLAIQWVACFTSNIHNNEPFVARDLIKPLRVRSSDDSDATIAKLRKTEGDNPYVINQLRRHNSEELFTKPFDMATGKII